MHDIARFREGAFNPEAMETLTKAYALALDVLGAATEDQKSRLAKHLMEIARSGEMDEERLSSLAVLRVLSRGSTVPTS